MSGGQRQRVAIARAFLSKARIIVLDEPTSSLDLASEQDIRNSLDAMVRHGRVTVIVIAHRPSTLKAAQHVVAMLSGKVLAQRDGGSLGEHELVSLMTGDRYPQLESIGS